MANELITANTEPATEIDQDELRKASEAFGVPYVDPAEEARARKRFENPDMNDPGFVTSIKSGVGQQASALARAAKDMPLIGGSGAVDALKRWGERTQENNPTVVHSLQDVVDHPVDTFKEGAGNAVAQMPANVGGGMAGRVIGGVIGARLGNAALGQKLGSWVGMGLPTLAQEYGGIRQEQDQEVAEGNLEADDKLQALKGAAPAAAIEFGLGPQRAIGHIIGEGFEGSAKDLAKKLATETAGMSAKDATRHVVKSAAKEIGRQGVEEGAEELVQNPLEAWGAHKDPLSAETIDQSLTGAALGLAGGVVLGAPTTAIQHHTAKTMVDNGQVTPDAPIAPPVTPSGPLGQAAAAGQAATPPAPEIPAAPVDPLAERIAAMAPTMESRDLLRQMRSDPRYGQETVTDALHAWAIGRNPNLDPKTRERALDSLQQLFGKDNFNMGQAATDDAIPGEAQRVPDVPQQGLLDAPTENGMPPFDPFQDTPPLPSVPATPSALSAPSVASSHSVPVLPVSAGDDGLPSVPSQASTQATENADPSPSVKTDISAPSVDDGMDDKVLSAFNDVFGEEDRAPAQTVADPQAEIDARIAEARAEEQRTAARNLIRDRVAHGFTAIENRALVNPKTGETHALNNPAEIMVAQTAIRRAIDEAAHSAATSDQNDLAQPSEAQKIAGNYAKGHLEWNGLNLAIENPKGSNRSGVDPNGQAWSVTMPAHYGYVKKTLGADGDQVDVYLGNAAHSNKVYVVDQIDADTGKFDEHKAIGNVRSLSEATALYDSGFSDGRGAQRRGAITEMTGEQFRDWVKNGDTTKPLAYSAPTANSQERKESHRPRLGESVASVWAGIKAANGGVVVDGKILYPAIKVPGMAGTFRMANDFTLEKLVDGGKGTVKASPEENRDIDDAVEKDQAEVVVLSRWGYSGDKNGRQTVVQVLHSPAGNSYQPLTNPTQPEETHVQKAPEAVQAEAQGSEQQQSAGAQLTLAGTEDAANQAIEDLIAEQTPPEGSPTDEENESANIADSEKSDVAPSNSEKRNIWIPNMTVSKLEKLLAKQKRTADDIEDLKDFKQFLLTDEQSAIEKGFMVGYKADGGAVYVLKNKFWLTNIDAAIADFENNAAPTEKATDEAQNTDTNADGQGTASELRAEEGGRTGGKGPAGPWTAGEIRDGDVAIIPAESYLSTELPDDGSPDPVRPVDTAVIGRLLAERDAALGLTLPGIDERAGLPADLTITVGDDADAPAYAGRFDVAWRGNIITLHQGAIEDLDETDEIHGIPPLALPTLLDKNAESDGLGYWTVGSDPTPMDFLDAVEHAFVRLSALPAFEGPAVSKLEVAKEKVKERAEVAKEEAKGNPAPVQEYATGSRVIISSDYYEKDLAGRHAVVTGFSTGMARITAIGLDHSGVYGRNERIEYSPSYSVKTDAGMALDYIYPSSLQAEGETAAPSVVPDIDIPTGPNGIGGMYTPNRLRDKIAYALRSAESNNAAAGRARLSTKKANLRAAASKEQAKASDLTNAYNAWAAKHGQPQIAWRGEQVVEMGAPAVSASTTAPTSAAAPVAPTDTAGTLKAAGLVVKESTTKNGKQVWEVTGNTKEHVDLMKRYGGRWYGPKKAWSFYDADPSEKIAAGLANKGVKPAAPEAPPVLADNEVQLEGNPYVYRFEGGTWSFRVAGGTTPAAARWSPVKPGPELLAKLQAALPANKAANTSAQSTTAVDDVEASVLEAFANVFDEPVTPNLEVTAERAKAKADTKTEPSAAVKAAAAKLSIVPGGTDGTPFIVRDPADKGGQGATLASFQLGASGQPVQIRHYYSHTQDVANLAIQNWAKANKPAAAPKTAATKAREERAQFAKEDTARAAAASAAKNVGMGLADVAKGLSALFKPKPGTLGSGPFIFNEDTYAAAKPLFAAGLSHFRQAGADVVAMATALIKSLRDQFGMDRDTVKEMLPYITQYMRDVQSGKIDYSEIENGGVNESDPSTDEAAGNGEVSPLGTDGSAEDRGRGSPDQQTDASGNPAGVGGLSPGNDGRAKQGGNRGTVRGRVPGEDVGGAGAVSGGGDALAGQQGAGLPGMADDVSAGAAGGTGSGRRGLGNYHIADPEALIGGSPRVRFERNKAAIETYQNVKAEGRAPTAAERDAIARFIGWGSFGQELFQGTWEHPKPKPEWRDADAWLREHMGRAEWESAQASIINAHYTDPPTVTAMWDMVRQMGFTGGRVLEPSMGIGNFYGLMPRDLMEKSQLTGIEMETMTGEMAQMLYPDANIQIKPYQDSKTADGFYDLVIGNWPFAADAPLDRRYRRLSPTLHDFFFLKALDQTRAGGLVVGITSSGTMDKVGESTRLALAHKADLIAAIRLPSGAFEKYAGTSVVTDILVFQKRENDNPNAGMEPWVKTREIDTPEGSKIRVNAYFADNPGRVLGTLNYGHGTTRGVPGMIVDRPADLMERLQALPAMLPADTYAPAARGKHLSFIANHTNDRQQSVTIGADNGLYVVNGEHLTPILEASDYRLKDTKKTAAREAQLRSLIGLRRSYADLIQKERTAPEQAEAARKALNKLYKAFVKEHGFINASDGMKILKKIGDPFHPSLAALEIKDGESYRPAAILSRPTMRGAAALDNPTVRDAFVLARNQSMHLDMEAIAKAARVPVEQAIAELTQSGAVFRTPAGNYEVADVYLSGNVRVKLHEAEAAQADGIDMAANIAALREVIPPDMPYYRIEAKLGAPWVPVPQYVNFIAEMLGVSPEDAKAIKVENRMGRWNVAFDDPTFNRRPEAQTVHGVPFYAFHKILRAAMNNLSITIRERDSDGREYVNEVATAEVNSKATTIRENFSSWIWSDIDRRMALEKDYNEVMRAVAAPHFDGSFLALEGMALQRGSSDFNLRQHQTNAIWRGLVNQCGIYAHEVGPQPLDAKILTPSGWTTMGEVKPGMMVVAADGTPTAVEAIYPKGEKTVYRVIFSDGSSTECCDDHLWLTSTYAERNYAVRQGDNDWPCAAPKVRPLHEIRRELRAPHLGAKNHRIPIVSPVQFAERPVALSPYLLGALLGDGGLSGRGVTLTTADSEIADACRLNLPAGAKMERVKATGRCATWTLTSADAIGRNAKGCINPVKDALDALGLRGKSSHDKFIPDDYLFNTIENRVELLRGLMDTDGSVAKSGHSVYFYTTSERLKEGVVTLVQSLGGTVSVKEKQPTYTHLGEKRAGRLCYVLCLKLPATVNPFRLPRKALAVVPKTSYAPARYIVDVQPAGTKPVQCIRVAHPDHLYVTDDFIVTHNTGKTYTMGGLAIESRRYGLAKKPLIFAHNANSSAVVREIQEMYPAAKLLYVDNLSPDNINVTLRQIANDDWDAVVVPHSLISRFSLTQETLTEIAREEIAALEEEAIIASQEENSPITVEMMDDEERMRTVRSPTAKELVRARNMILARIASMAMAASKEGAIPFEELGVDMIIVDEAHAFKKPPLTTRMKMKGLNKGVSVQSIAMRFLTDYVKKQNSGKGVHLFTGTPITNTLTEIYNLQRYVADPQMQRDGVKDWDSWFSTFADSMTDVELTSTGEYEAVTRLSAFINTADLRNMIGAYTDIVFADDMPEFAPRPTSTGKVLSDEGLTDDERDELLNGKNPKPVGRPYKKIVNDVAAMTPEQAAILEDLQGLARSFKNASPLDRKRRSSGGHVSAPLYIETSAPAAGLDPRLYDMSAPDHPDLKVNRVTRNVLHHYNEDKLATQVVFVERGYTDWTERNARTPDGWTQKDGDNKSIKEKVATFNLVKDMVDKMVAGGIPRNEIAVVQGTTSQAKRLETAAAMNEGRIRVVIGLTSTLGIGVNMQKHLRAMHHMDAPWMPGDLEQRNGRGQRQGNEWNTIYEYRYITDRVDGRRWQVLAVKDRFIKQFLKADADTRIIEGDAVSDEDDSDIMSSLSEAAGDPRILLRQRYKAEVEKLDHRLYMHDQGRADSRRRAQTLNEEIGRIKRTAADIAEDIAHAAAMREKGGFSITVDGKEYTVRHDADAAIKAFVEDMEPRTQPYKLGKIGDFALSFSLSHQNAPLIGVMRGPSGQEYYIKASTASIESILRNLPDHLAKMEKDIADKEKSIPRLIESANAPFPRADDLARKKLLLAQLDADLQTNPVPPPPWLRQGAPNQTLIYVGNKPFEVEGHQYAKDGYFVLVKTPAGSRRVPYSYAKDEFGMDLYEEHPFTAPPEAVRTFQPNDEVIAANGDHWKILRQPHVQDNVQIVLAQHIGSSRTEEIQTAGLRHVELPPLPPIPLLDLAEVAAPKIEPASDSRMTQDQEIGQSEFEEAAMTGALPGEARFSANSGEASISPADKAVYGMVAEGKGTHAVLKFIASASRTPFNRELARLLLQTGINPALTLSDTKGWKFAAGQDKKYSAAYNPKTDTASLFRVPSAERHLLHELVHAATLQALTKKGMAAVKLRALFASVKKSGKLKGMYGMSDVDEFIAEAFTNPFFQQKLKGVRVNEGAGKVQSAWQWFVRIVRSILGLKPGQENALSAVMELGVGVMRENMALNKAADGKVRYADYTVVHELRHSDTNRALDGAELQTLRRAAAGLERPKDGVFLRVTADGFAIGTGPKGARIPESFRRFAANHRLTFRAERRIPNYAPGRPAYSGAHVTTKTEPMPISYRQDGALYFGEQPGGALDRTSRTRFNIIEESASGTRPADDYENKPTPLTPERLPPTIRVDGVSRPTMNSEGRQIHPSREGVENFWRWFDGVRPEGLGEASQSSKDASGLFGADHGTTRGLDANGRPRVFFHGTADAVDAFDLKHPKRKDSGWLGRGVYLTTDTDLAESYANFKGQHQDQTIMPLYAAIRNPFYATLALKKRLSKATQAQIDVVTNNLIKAGFDGVVLEFNDDTAEVVAFSPEQVKSASGNSGGFDPSDDRIRYSSAADPSSINGEPAVERWSDIIHSPDVMKSLRQQIADQFATQQTFNWWHKTVGSQFHKAKIDTLPGKAAGDLGTFGAVVDQAQQYLDTTSRLAAEAADFAPGLLPKTNGLVDAWRGIKNMRTDARDAQAIAGPVFHGTLADKVFTDSELRNPPDDAFGKPLFAPLTDRQIELYRQYRATIDRSLDDLAVSEMARLSHPAQMQPAPAGLSLRDAVEFYRQQYADALEDARDRLEETKANHADELRMLESAAEDGAAGADERNKYANLREKMKARHAAELNAAEKTLASLEEIEKGIVGRAAAVEKLKQQGYSPLMRFGQYTVDVIYQDDKGNPIKDTDGNDMRPFFGMYESEAMANKVARALKAEYPGATIKQGVMAQNAAAMFKGVTPETLEVFGKLMGAEQDEAFQNYLKLAVNNRSAMKRLIHRMGIHGFNEDPTRVLASFVTSNARAASGNYHLGAMLRATAAIPQHKGDVKDEAVKLMNYLQNPAEEGAWVRSVLFANFLGGSVASAMVNLTQTFTTTIPYLHQFGGNTTKNVLSAMKLAAGRMRSNKKSTGDPDLDKALQRAEEEGIVAPHEIHMLQGEATRSGVLTGNRFTRNLMKAWGSMFSMAEAYNREVAFIASYKVAQAKGMRGNDAYLFAGDAVSQTQFQYSKASRANWGRGPVGATLMTFKTFTVNYLEFLKRLPPKERALALAVIFVAAGAQGLPFADDLDDLLDTIMQTLGFSWNTKQQKRAAIASVLGEGAAGFIQYGVSYGLPLDLASRIGLSNLIPGSAIFKPSETNKTRDVAEFFGAAGGALQQAMNAFSQAQAGSFTQAGMTLVPKAIRDLGKGIDMAGKGYYTDTRGRRVADTNGIEAAAKFIGFQPTVIAEDSRARSIVMDQSMLYRSVQGQIHSLWAEGLIEGDPDKVQKAQARLNAWNEDNPESRMLVSRGAILRRVRQARLTADQRLINTAPKMMRQQLRPTLEGEY